MQRLKASGGYDATWAQGVLTLVSIVLGVAMAVASQRLFEIADLPNGKISIDLTLQAVAIFFITTGTFYHCYTITSFYHVVPSFLWVTLPTGTGIGVIMCAYSIGNTERFLISTIVFYCCGTACFLYALFENSQSRVGTSLRDVASEKASIKLFSRELAKNTVCFILMGLGTALIYYQLYITHSTLPLSAEKIYTFATGIIYSFMVWWTETLFLGRARMLWKNSE